MRLHRVDRPAIHPTTLKLFHLYARWYMHWNLHSIRVNTLRPASLPGTPIVVCMNHPSWWDPLVTMTLALRLYPERRHYAPMEANALLTKYGFFEKIGFFGVEPGSAKGAAKFLRMASSIVSHPDSMLWVTAQGTFSDVRRRPATLRSGLGRLAARHPSFAVLPVALEFVYWQDRLPEALVHFGEPILVADAPARSAEEWTAEFAHSLELAQDALAAASIARDESAFHWFAGGREGVGGIYGLWRAATAKFRRELRRV